MRIISININGVQQAASNGLFDWLASQNAEVICLQNTRASSEQTLQLAGQLTQEYFAYANDGDAQQQSGVAIFSKVAPKAIIREPGINMENASARFIQADFDKISVASLLFPSGLEDVADMANKSRFMQNMLEVLQKQVGKRRNYIYCSSTYIAHRKIDVKFWRTAQYEIGFLPAERDWMNQLFEQYGYLDALREVNHASDQFSYFANSTRDSTTRLGWRFDYQLLTPGLRGQVKHARVLRNPDFGGHCPVQIDYNWQLSN